MSKNALENKVAALEALRALEDRGAAERGLRVALRDANNYLVSKAATIAGDLAFDSLTPDLKGAFERFLLGGADTDPKCWAKLALVKALRDLNYDDPDVYVAGLRCVQKEASWGGSIDTAAGVRGACALALIATRMGDLEILSKLTDCLADPEKTVRMDAAAALGQLGREEGGLLLRLKAMLGDAEPEVVGQCFHSLLAIAPEEYVGFVSRYLRHENEDIQLEAAIALAQAKEAAALDALKRFWANPIAPDVRKGLVVALGASPLKPAAEWLAQMIEEYGRTELGVLARRALSNSRYREEFAALL